MRMMQNGECRLLSLPADAETDEQGFLDNQYSARSSSFLPCVWNYKAASSSGSGGEEEILSGAVRGTHFYEISVPMTHDGEAVLALNSDRIELKQKIGAAGITTLEIIALNNQSNVAWLIYALDTDAENAG
jgi:hypothetical protein